MDGIYLKITQVPVRSIIYSADVILLSHGYYYAVNWIASKETWYQSPKQQFTTQSDLFCVDCH
jgi:hypothetical protein